MCALSDSRIITGIVTASVVATSLILSGSTAVAAFLPPPPSPRGRIGGASPLSGRRGDGGGSGGDGRTPRYSPGGGDSNEDPLNQQSFVDWIQDFDEEKDGVWTAFDKKKATSGAFDFPRGGDSQNTRENLVKGTSATLASTASFWGNTFKSATSTVAKPFQIVSSKISPRFRSKAKRREEALLEQLRTMPVRQVTIPNTTLLPYDVIQIAARRSGLVGQPLRTDRVQDFAAALQRWYQRNGYVLNSVTGATLLPETGTAEISVREATTAQQPVGIVFLKEMVVDEESGTLLTPRQYKERHELRKTRGFHKRVKSRQDLNTTYVTTDLGRTRPGSIASALRLEPGQPFQWHAPRWQRVAQSGIFARIIRAAPEPLKDGTVQLQIVATEAPPRHLEYGVGKSLYTGSWEGELDFEHVNLLGGAETLGVSVRRGTKDVMPSVRLRFSDDRFGMEGGYDVEAFSEYIGGDEAEGKPTESAALAPAALADASGTEETPPAVPLAVPPAVVEEAEYNTRRGASFRLRNPIDPHLIENTEATASLELATSKSGLRESIGSACLGLGPFVRELPLGARSNVDARFTAGTRVAEAKAESTTSRVRPYSAVTAVTRQTFPLLTTTSSSRATRPILLALKHAVTTSSKSLPQHEAKAQGISCSVRGAGSPGRISTALSGTTELRIPVQLPIKKVQQDASVVVFGDWLFAKKDASSTFFRKSSVGLGIRKSMQGVPIQYNLSYCNDGKIKATFGLGKDFEV